jgi:hypothetical protein
LVVPSGDLIGFLITKTREELVALLSSFNVPTRKSWNKEKLARLALEHARRHVEEMASKVVLAKVAPEYEPVIPAALDYARRTKTVYQLWLGFGVSFADSERG